ncbi:MAG: N-acetylglucosamine kinase [Mycobacterium sp.]
MTREPKSLLVEGGGSHTWVAVADRQRVWTEVRLPSLNRIGASKDAQRAVLAHVARAAGQFEDIEAALFAVGAACTNMYLDEFTELLTTTLPESTRPPGRTHVTNDVVPLFLAEPADKSQLVVIAGTGSGIAARRGFHAFSRKGAHEYLLGDEGGAYDIGRRALRAVIAQLEGRGPATSLAALAVQRTNGLEIDRFVYESDNPKQSIADFARDVFAADRDGDLVADQILSRAAAQLTELSCTALAAVGSPAQVTATFTGTLLTEPTGRLRHRLERQLLRAGVGTFRTCTVDIELMRRTLTALRSDQMIFEAMGSAIPAVRL